MRVPRDLFGRSAGLAETLAPRFAEEPVTLVDVGCSGGIHPSWSIFGSGLVAYGFDPNRSEVERLRAAEHRPDVNYVAAYVGTGGSDVDSSLAIDAWERSSAAAANRRWESRTAEEDIRRLHQANIFTGDSYVQADETLLLTEFMRTRVRHIDFLKIDVDGSDLGVLRSFEAGLREFAVLGVMMEVNFPGSADPSSNTLHNVDRLLKANGFELWDIEPRHYTTAVLPGVFVHDVPGPTFTGRVVQADALWFRDVLHRNAVPEFRWSPIKMLKLVSLLDFFGHADSAAELLIAEQDLLSSVDARTLLDAVVPRRIAQSYAEHLRLFEADDLRFYGGRVRRLKRRLRETALRGRAILRRTLR